MMMKFRIRRSLVLVTFSILFLILCWSTVTYFNYFERNESQTKLITTKLKENANKRWNRVLDNENGKPENSKDFKKLDCLINDEFTVGCYKSSDEMVYVPFNFLRRYFEISGKLLKKENGVQYFKWDHSYSKVFYPREPYDHIGPFLWFENYNVEVRDRVRCISAIHGVPISIQWDPKGHFYPIQIAQFGLSHFSKNLTSLKPRILQLEDGNLLHDNWQLEVHGSDFQIKSMIENESTSGNKVLFLEGNSVSFKIKRRKSNTDLVLIMKVKPLGNFSITTILQSDSALEYSVTYTTSNLDMFLGEDNSLNYGIGIDSSWKTLTRDLGVDLFKAFTLLNKKLEVKPRNLHLYKIIFNGKAFIDDVALASSAHDSQFKTAAKWLLNNQDDYGGWPIKVTRKLSSGALILHPGWYSAMGQGQAISTLTRMYQITGNEEFLNSAIKALNIFSVNSSQNGIRAFFLDKIVWYEEYPTLPSSFVLNGFIYSLFGLYDLKSTCQKEECQLAHKLFKDGIQSLKLMLPLFDTGSGSVYDLRHFSLGISPNLARWDYHTTHINQLLYLSTISSELIFQTTAKRWISYMKGKRAPHN